MRDLHAQWQRTGGHQVCHYFGSEGDEEGEVDGADVWCRGFFETQVDPEVQALMYGLAEVGIVTFVEVPNE